MKLYATVTSERAGKGQGGNRYMRVSLTIDRGEELILGAHVRDDGDVDVLLSRSTDTGGVELWRDRVKRGVDFEKIQNFGEQHPLFHSSEMNKWRKGKNIVCHECGNTFHGTNGKEDTCPDCLKKAMQTEKGERQNGESRPEKCYTCKSPYFNMAHTCQGCGRQY